jgi:kumamolisin
VKTSKMGILTFIFVLGMLPRAMAQTASEEPENHVAVPYPTAETPKAIDRGELSVLSEKTPISVTLALNFTKLNEAESLLKSLQTPGDPQFRHYLTAEQFEARFAPTDAQVGQVIAGLAKYGLTAQRSSAMTLKVSGLPADMERAFAVSLHVYEVPAHGNASGYSFRVSLSGPTIPAEISASVAAVIGLDSHPRYRPHYAFAPQKLVASRRQAVSAAAGNPPGLWTVADFASHYDVLPLYKRGVTGEGRTIGIVTFAAFTPSDAFAYWSALGLAVNPKRINIVNIDGGPGAPSDASGSVETTLDVEQSGGIAPGAKIIVYQGTNTDQSFIDAFAAAVESDSAETVSVSWGDWELCTNLFNTPYTCPTTAPDPGYISAKHELFVRAAIQGQTLFAASGDYGAYLNYSDCPASDTCSLTLSVDSPADDTAITAAGGTTLASIQEYCINASCTPPYTIEIPNERVWGWDYLDGLCATLGLNPITCGIFPLGSSGGVSVLFERPVYQSFVPGVESSQPDQSWIVNGNLVRALPSYFPGRNVPDVSFNADPNTGYIVYYTSDVTGFAVLQGGGGTSFVAPQLNGVSTLMGEYLNGSRLGLLNFPLYGLAVSGQAYRGANPPLHAIAYGDNWFYHGSHGYNPAAGLGTLDVANFAAFLRELNY